MQVLRRGGGLVPHPFVSPKSVAGSLTINQPSALYWHLTSTFKSSSMLIIRGKLTNILQLLHLTVTIIIFDQKLHQRGGVAALTDICIVRTVPPLVVGAYYHNPASSSSSSSCSISLFTQIIMNISADLRHQ